MKSLHSFGFRAAIIATAAFCFPACFLTPDPPPNPGPPDSGEPEMEVGQATVDTVRVLSMESFPVQAFAWVTGTLPGGAWSLGEPTQTRHGNTIRIALPMKKPVDAIGTMALVPFDTRIPLDIAGLPRGTYTVTVNGVSDTLTLATDNAP